MSIQRQVHSCTGISRLYKIEFPFVFYLKTTSHGIALKREREGAERNFLTVKMKISNHSIYLKLELGQYR